MSGEVGKKGQVTIFIIIAILIVVGVVIFFLFRSDVIKTKGFGGNEINAEAYMFECVQPELEATLEKAFEMGGTFIPEEVQEFTLEEEGFARNYSYLCYTDNLGEKCTNLAAGLKTRLESAMLDELKGTLEDCYSGLEEELSKEYSVSVQTSFNDLEIAPEEIVITLGKKITLTKEDSAKVIEEISFNIQSDLYEMLGLANEIVNSEAGECQYDFINYMNFNPEIEIRHYTTSRGEDIYTIKKRDSNEDKFRFATRGCLN